MLPELQSRLLNSSILCSSLCSAVHWTWFNLCCIICRCMKDIFILVFRKHWLAYSMYCLAWKKSSVFVYNVMFSSFLKMCHCRQSWWHERQWLDLVLCLFHWDQGCKRVKWQVKDSIRYLHGPLLVLCKTLVIHWSEMIKKPLWKHGSLFKNCQRVKAFRPSSGQTQDGCQIPTFVPVRYCIPVVAW